jgi:predicted RNA-binding protein with PIN domain
LGEAVGSRGRRSAVEAWGYWCSRMALYVAALDMLEWSTVVGSMALRLVARRMLESIASVCEVRDC